MKYMIVCTDLAKVKVAFLFGELSFPFCPPVLVMFTLMSVWPNSIHICPSVLVMFTLMLLRWMYGIIQLLWMTF